MPRKGKIQMVYDNRAALERGDVIPRKGSPTTLELMERRAIKETARLNIPVRHPHHYLRLSRELHELADKMAQLGQNNSLDEIDKAGRLASWCRMQTRLWHDEVVLFERRRRPEDYGDWGGRDE